MIYYDSCIFSCDKPFKPYLKIKCGMDNIPIENHPLSNLYWMSKMHKIPIKASFTIASPKLSIKSLARTITSKIRLFSREIQTYNDKCRFFTGANTLWVVQNNKPVTDAMNGELMQLYTKLPHNKLLMLLNSLIDFY